LLQKTFPSCKIEFLPKEQNSFFHLFKGTLSRDKALKDVTQIGAKHCLSKCAPDLLSKKEILKIH
jgi:hypothetical protein